MRGIFEPDEGRYTNVALMMLDRGDWLTPMRNEITGHWTKPPMTYWLIAASVWAFGQEAWAARLPIAFSFLVCVACVGWIARHCAPGREAKAMLVFATMLAPCLAAQLVTTDFPLSAAEAVAMAMFVQARFGHARWRSAAWIGMWAAFGVAFLIKGPPGVLPLLAVLAHAGFVRGASVGVRWHVAGLAVFFAIALPWYAAVVARHEGLLAYFLGAEVLDRVASDRFDRNGGWFGWARVYAPMLLLGSLPWTFSFWRWLRDVAGRMRAWRDVRERTRDASRLLLALWFTLPLFVFCLAQSRLPLYVLPLFVPIAVAVSTVDARWPKWPSLAAWAACLLALRVIAAHWPAPLDSARWAQEIAARAEGPVRKVVFVQDTPRWGLHLHLDAQVERHSHAPVEEPRFGRRYDADFASALATGSMPGTVYVAPVALWPGLRAISVTAGYVARPLGAVHHGRQVFELRPSP
ncbi:glycosyltransferase family 39 protein [Lysobacter sp. KIS68-7]|uniref:ArnT family glycosyltransferase n=1 Tax=Lysobacter sp. KIS68-7 TaxID=2904252 RepID=UPI001E4BEC4E|nr:glycosyltransferase family 39 protein [Lysobacter sp. KIS68-7]UHQ20908.1 glycosyltransferase family 39 protein [Lysobacter sp. KIS68-7]